MNMQSPATKGQPSDVLKTTKNLGQSPTCTRPAP